MSRKLPEKEKIKDRPVGFRDAEWTELKRASKQHTGVGRYLWSLYEKTKTNTSR